jgi:uncharacterized protein (TIGR00252 family)
MSATDVGQAAETAATGELVRQGFVIVARNWRTKWCEVDIIARKADVIWFIEVKYRMTEKFGGGLEYIGRQKLLHLERAASLWTNQQHYEGEYTLGAVAVTGDNLVGELLEI